MPSESKGTYSVSKSSTYKCGWRLQKKFWIDRKPVNEVVPMNAWLALGFSPTMTIEEARSRASQLNTIRSLDVERARKAAANYTSFKAIESAFLPKHLVDEFSKQLLGRRYTSDRTKKKLQSHWLKLTLLIKDLKIEPSFYEEHSEDIYDWFISKTVSPEYANKLISMLNRWGYLCCKKEGKFFEPVKMPKGRDRAAIAEAYVKSDNFQGESNPLTPAMLENKRSLMQDKHYKYLFVSVWFGLRPEEIDQLPNNEGITWRVEADKQTKVDVFWVYQPKLVALHPDKRWKPLPIIFDEQKTAVEYVKEGLLYRPILKHMRTWFKEGVTLYAGRKGFQDLMLDRGQILENISMWMGHQDISRTWKSYRNKRRVAFNKPA